MIQTVKTIKPRRVIDAEDKLTALQAKPVESFEAWKKRQVGAVTGTGTAVSVAERASVILTRLKDMQSPGVPAPRSEVGRWSMGHVRFNAPRPSCGLPVRRELVKDKQWGEPARRVVDRPTSAELRGFRWDAPRALPEDWEDFDTVIDAQGKPLKVFRTRAAKLSRRANRLGLMAPTVSMESQSDVLERMKTQHLVQNVWRPINPVLPVFPAGRVGVQDRLPVGISPFSAAPQVGAPGPCAVPNLIATQGLRAFQQWRVLRAAGPVRPPVTC
jgi:hypothetical protein